MPAIGGSPLMVVPGKDQEENWLRGQPPQWSPDGAELAYLVNSTVQDTVLFLVKIRSLHTGAVRSVNLPGKENFSVRYLLKWSPDGRYFAYIGGPDQVWVLRLADGEGFPVVEGGFPSWSADGRTLYFILDRGGVRDLWQQRLNEDRRPQGPPQQLTVGIRMMQAAFSPDGTKLAYSQGDEVSNLWRIPILSDRPATWADAREMTTEQAYIQFVDVSPDERRVLFSSDRTGNMDLWMADLSSDGAVSTPRQLTTESTAERYPRWSPDGKEILFHTDRSGNRDIWVMPAGGVWGGSLRFTKRMTCARRGRRTVARWRLNRTAVGTLTSG